MDTVVTMVDPTTIPSKRVQIHFHNYQNCINKQNSYNKMSLTSFYFYVHNEANHETCQRKGEQVKFS
jgi:hypothetical protein